MRKTKIVCTLGPKSDREEIIEAMLKAGMNVARVNFSHGTHESQGKMIDKFRSVRNRLGMPAAVLLDTKGPEIRTGDFEGGKATLVHGQNFVLDTKPCMGNTDRCFITYDKLPVEVTSGTTILIDDGKLRLKVSHTNETEIFCRVIDGGELSNHKGINVPSISLKMEYLSERDKSDILFGIEKDVDYIAASFVRRGQDVIDLRNFLKENGGEKIKIISKIENVEGINNFEEILTLSDGIMVARGDMGVEIDFQKVPGVQKRIIKRSRQSGKICITATQMLDSMIENPRPTRAEVTDVANAVYDGTSAVMLSGETANGKYPVQSVIAMAKIAEQAEQDDPRFVKGQDVYYELDSSDTTNAVGHAACTLAKDISASAIIAITTSGYTAARMSKFRPQTNIIAATPHYKTFNQLCLNWGVTPVVVENEFDLEKLIASCIDASKKTGLVKKGDKVVISLGLPLNIPGNTNMVRVENVY